MNTTFVGTGRLVRSMLQEDRMRLLVWALLLSGFAAYAALVLPRVFGADGLQARAAVMAEPAGAMMAGPGYGLDDYTIGALMANEMLGLLAVAVAIMSLLLVVRHTRGDEEAGRTELLRAAPLGRHAQLAAALTVLLVANAVVGTLLSAALLAAGLGAADSWAFGAAVAAVGLVFGGIAATTAQLSSHARAASGMAGAVLGAAYVLRAVGDAQERGGSALSWASPIGWAQQMRLFVDLRWWPLLLLVALAVAGAALGYALEARRDVGAGLLPDRRGRVRATAAGRTLVGLTLRLERGRITWWAVGLFVFGALTGSIAGPMAETMASQPQLLAVLGVDPTDEEAMANLVSEAMGAFLKFFAMAVAVYGLAATHRLRSDEAGGRAELALAAAVPRARWAGAPLLVHLGASLLLLVVAGAGLGLGASSEIGAAAVGEFALAALAYGPLLACWVAAAMLLYGLGWSSVPLWALLIVVFVVGMYGPLFELPQAVLDVEPFGMIDALALAGPGDGDATPLAVGAGTAVVLAVAGLALFRRRDLRL
ncbi:polyketide antibiotic transporter [Zhihengliuella sp.]|uniref:ABC transporter permease n=1 Tax=Zhihengliuella sp. TaxID=1954483 RepID=UPI002811870D|nr:polyketide antibiotic transporter [Zhihengliuella sp.]